jgi:hypothetical protein
MDPQVVSSESPTLLWSVSEEPEGVADGKQAELFRIHAAQEWSGIREDDLQISDT